MNKSTKEVQMNEFGWALKQMRHGLKVRRTEWNGQGMWIVLQKGYPEGIKINQNTADATGIRQGVTCKFLPYIMMKVVSPLEIDETTGEVFSTPTFVPWLASQTDILSTDWESA